MVQDEDDLGLDDELEEAARQLGWSVDYLRRARQAGVPLSTLWRFTNWGLPQEQMERKLQWHEQLTSGLRGRLATRDDNEGFCELWANSPESIGEFEVISERGPNGFAQYQLQGDVQTLLLADGPRIVASCSFAIRNVLVSGEKICVHYGQGLRVHSDYRRKGFGDQVRSLSWGIGSKPTACQYDIMRTQNFAVVGWWEKYMPDFWKDVPQQEGEVPGVPVVVHQLPAAPFSGDATGIRPAKPEDLARCAELVNRTHEGSDLFQPYSEERLGDRLDQGFWGDTPPWWDHVYGWGDLFVVEEGGRIVACGGLWDRGRDLRERWRHKETGDERTLSDTALMDFGYKAGAEDAMLRLIATLAGRTHELGRDHLLAPVQQLSTVSERLEADGAVPDRRALRWGHPQLEVARPYTDLAYW